VKLDVLKMDGSASGDSVELKPEIFEIKPNDHAIWFAVRAEMANRRQGTSSAKTRAQVSGGGKKPWPQKGRGTARAGSTRSPVWVHGGRVFGPTPRDYSMSMPKKLKSLARKSALSYKAKDKKITLVEDFVFDKPKTKQMAGLLKKFKIDQTKVLLLLPASNRTLLLTSRNLQHLEVREANGFSTYDVVKADILLIQKSALTKIHEVLGK
jgi:large subunit ribosomal protein L4